MSQPGSCAYCGRSFTSSSQFTYGVLQPFGRRRQFAGGRKMCRALEACIRRASSPKWRESHHEDAETHWGADGGR